MFTFLNGLDDDFRKALLIQLRNLWTHTSMAIEGNTLTLGETAFVLEEGLTISGKPLKDHEEVVGHARAIDLIYDIVKQERDLTETDLFDLHKEVQTEMVVDVFKPVGAWKVEPNSTVNVVEGRQIIFEFSPPQSVQELMQKWLGLFSEFNRVPPGDKDKALEAYVQLHFSFVHIHPFWDSNGRLARLVANIPVIRAGLPPIIIPMEKRRLYLEILAKYHLEKGTIRAGDELVDSPDEIQPFRRLCNDCWAETMALVEAVKEKQQERNQRSE